MIVIDCSELSAEEKLALAMQISDTLDGIAIALVKGEDIVMDKVSQEKPEVFVVKEAVEDFISRRKDAAHYFIEEVGERIVVHSADPPARCERRPRISSLLSLVESNFGLPSIGQRDSVGIGKNDMMNSFDFSQKPQPALMEAGNFLGPGNSPPQSNGYPAYGGQSSSSSTSSFTSSSSSSSTVPEFGANAAFYSLLGLVTFVAIATPFVYQIRKSG